MKAVILAGGKGIRLLPLTLEKPKVLVEVSGKPFLWHVLNRVISAGASEIGIVIGYKKEKVVEFIEQYKSKWPNVSFSFIEQPEQLGTGHAVLLAESFAGSESVLVVNGDCLHSAADLKLVASSPENCVAGFSVEEPSRYGVLLHENFKLREILEKSKNPPSNLANAGAYKFAPEVFTALKQISKSPRGEYELTDAITMLAKAGKVSVAVLKDYWLELGKLDDIPVLEQSIKE